MREMLQLYDRFTRFPRAMAVAMIQGKLKKKNRTDYTSAQVYKGGSFPSIRFNDLQ